MSFVWTEACWIKFFLWVNTLLHLSHSKRSSLSRKTFGITSIESLLGFIGFIKWTEDICLFKLELDANTFSHRPHFNRSSSACAFLTPIFDFLSIWFSRCSRRDSGFRNSFPHMLHENCVSSLWTFSKCLLKKVFVRNPLSHFVHLKAALSLKFVIWWLFSGVSWTFLSFSLAGKSITEKMLDYFIIYLWKYLIKKFGRVSNQYWRKKLIIWRPFSKLDLTVWNLWLQDEIFWIFSLVLI